MRRLTLMSLLMSAFVGLGCYSKVATVPGPAPVATYMVATAAPAAAATKPADFAFTKAPVVTLTEAEIRDGWIQLFDGQTLFGWKANTDVDWHVTADGEIEASTGKAGLLNTTVPFADYEFRCDYWIEKAANSGVFLRTVEQPKDPAVDCYELNMWDAAPEFKTASLVKRVKPSKEVTGEERGRGRLSLHARP